MEGLLEFVEGPLFRFTFAVMILGLIRVFVLSLINGFEAKKKAKEKKIPMHYVNKLTFGNLFLWRSIRTRPIFAIVSILFHIGLILTPLLLYDHILLFDNSAGISWFFLALPKTAADYLTLLAIVTGIILVIMRTSSQVSRTISRKQDFLWPLILIVPFVTGYVCSNFVTSPQAYDAFILVHMLSGEFIFVLLPFTKIAHCVLMPISQWITARSWKFPPEAGEQVAVTLGKEGEKL